jgi:hypothetical protein
MFYVLFLLEIILYTQHGKLSRCILYNIKLAAPFTLISTNYQTMIVEFNFQMQIKFFENLKIIFVKDPS